MEKYYGIALVIIATLLMIAVLVRPIVRGILKEVREYNKQNIKDAVDACAKIAAALTTMFICMTSPGTTTNHDKPNLTELFNGKNDEGDK